MGPWQKLHEAVFPGEKDDDTDDVLKKYQSDPLKRGYQGATTAARPKDQDITSAVPKGASRELRGVQGAGPGRPRPPEQRSGAPSGWEWLKQNDPEFTKKRASVDSPSAKTPEPRPSRIPMAGSPTAPGGSGPRDPGSASVRPAGSSPVPSGAGQRDTGPAVAAPKQAGTFVGQRWTAAGPIRPSRMPIDTRPQGQRSGTPGKEDTAWMPVQKKTQQSYVWDGGAWVDDATFAQKFPKQKK